MSATFYQSLPSNERSAVDFLFEAMNRLVPLGYYVGFLSPDDAMTIAPGLSREAAGTFIREHEHTWEEYLMGGNHARGLMQELMRENGIDCEGVGDS